MLGEKCRHPKHHPGESKLVVITHCFRHRHFSYLCKLFGTLSKLSLPEKKTDIADPLPNCIILVFSQSQHDLLSSSILLLIASVYSQLYAELIYLRVQSYTDRSVLLRVKDCNRAQFKGQCGSVVSASDLLQVDASQA